MKEIKFDPKKDLIFDYKVREQCKSCKRYGKRATCPPYVESVDYYKELLPTYKKGIIYYKKFIVDDPTKWKELGRQSSIFITTFLVKKRTQLISEGHYFCIAFSAGSCKNCVNCEIPCPFPDHSLIPMEGTGLNIVAMMKKFGIKIKIPIEDYFYRVGCILYD